YGDTNVSIILGNDENQEKPGNILSAERSMTCFEVTGLPDNTVCYTPIGGSGGSNARWDRDLCHGANAGNLGLGDGSVQQLTDATLVKTVRSIPVADTVDGFSLRYYIP